MPDFFPKPVNPPDISKEYVMFYSSHYEGVLTLYIAQKYSIHDSNMRVDSVVEFDATKNQLNIDWVDINIHKWNGTTWEYYIRNQYDKFVIADKGTEYKTLYGTYLDGVLLPDEWVNKFPPVEDRPEKVNNPEYILYKRDGLWRIAVLTPKFVSLDTVTVSEHIDPKYQEFKTGSDFYGGIYTWAGDSWGTLTYDYLGASGTNTFVADKDTPYKYKIAISGNLDEVIGIDVPPTQGDNDSGGSDYVSPIPSEQQPVGDTKLPPREVEPDIVPEGAVDGRVKRRVTLQPSTKQILYFGATGVREIIILLTGSANVEYKANTDIITIQDDTANLLNDYNRSATIKLNTTITKVALISDVMTTVQWVYKK